MKIKELGSEPYSKVSAIQALFMAVTISGDENQKQAYCNFLNLQRQSIQRLGPNDKGMIWNKSLNQSKVLTSKNISLISKDKMK